MPPSLQQVLGVALKGGYATVNTVEEEDADTHARVDQSYVVRFSLIIRCVPFPHSCAQLLPPLFMCCAVEVHN